MPTKAERAKWFKVSDIARFLDVNRKTVKRYMALLGYPTCNLYGECPPVHPDKLPDLLVAYYIGTHGQRSSPAPHLKGKRRRGSSGP